MPVFLDVELHGAAKAAQTAANEISQVFSRLGMGINRDLEKSIGKGFAAFDTSAGRASWSRCSKRRAARRPSGRTPLARWCVRPTNTVVGRTFPDPDTTPAAVGREWSRLAAHDSIGG